MQLPLQVCAVIECRRAGAEDARLLAQTRQIVWKQTYWGIYPDCMLDDYDIDYYEARDRARILDPNHHYYLFLDGETCVGYYSFGPYNYGTYRDFELCLNNLYIIESYKGMGLGKQAFSKIYQFCQANNIPKFFCGCNANNLPAVSFYLHMGGIQGDEALPNVPKEDQIIHFEFYIGE